MIARRATSTAAAVIVATLGIAANGCKDISRFSTAPGEAYCGQVVQGGFVRQGFAPDVKLRLHLDTDRLHDVPGNVSTRDGKFIDAPLRPIPQLAHDSLSTLDFGEGRVRNLLFAAQPEDGATAYVIISLLENENVEVRILRGAPATEGEADPLPEYGPDLFGVFPLVRQKGTCGF